MPNRNTKLHVIPHKTAKELGLKRYFTGKSCKLGHIRESQTSNGTCIECHRIRQLKPLEIKPKFNWKSHRWNKRGWCTVKLNYNDLAEKSCSSCGELKPINEFAKDIKNKSGYRSDCNQCKNDRTAVWKSINKDMLKESKAKWDAKNITNIALYAEKYRASDKVKAMRTASQGGRRARKIQATPAWFNKELVANIYIASKNRNMVVDHIVPLTSKFVCGLHCSDNLAVISSTDNSIKGNRYWPDMPNTNDPELIEMVKGANYAV